MVRIDVSILLFPGRSGAKTQLIIESANGTRLLDTYVEDLSVAERSLINLIIQGTGRQLGCLLSK